MCVILSLQFNNVLLNTLIVCAIKSACVANKMECVWLTSMFATMTDEDITRFNVYHVK